MATKPPTFVTITFFFFLLLLCSPATAKLNVDYYKKSCPNFENTIRDIIFNKQCQDTPTAAATLRLFFHDCFVEGCDGSALVGSTNNFKSERDADESLSIGGDAFDLVDRAKNALELACPGIVSCSDILAYATRNLVVQVGGPHYKVRLGRKDGFVSRAERVAKNLPAGNMTTTQLIQTFARKGFTVEEMVALSGAHTIGFSHCKEFSGRIYGNNVDRSMHPKLVASLQKACVNYKEDPSMAVFNDVMSPGKFDNQYYQNLPKGLGLLKTDQGLFGDPRTKPLIELYSRDQGAFFEAFGHAMEKLSVLGVKTGRKGEIRRTCDRFNALSTRSVDN